MGRASAPGPSPGQRHGGKKVMTSHSLFRTALLAGLVGTAGAAAAQGWGHRHGFGHDGAFPLLPALSLTDAQRSEVHAAMQAGHTASAPERAQLHAIDAQIKAKLLGSGSVAMADIAPLLQQKEQVTAQLDQQRMATMLQVRAVLTPEQIGKAASMDAQLASLHAQEDAVTGGAK